VIASGPPFWRRRTPAGRIWQDHLNGLRLLDLTTLQNQAIRRPDNATVSPSRRAAAASGFAGRPVTAAERVLASELQARGDQADALSMMVSSIARMVQAGKSCDSRWKAS
jgi:hypothetical protein